MSPARAAGMLERRVADAVVGDAVLGEVVGADFFGAVAGADEFLAGIAIVACCSASIFELQQAGAQDAHGLVFVLDLGFLVLVGDDQAGWAGG